MSVTTSLLSLLAIVVLTAGTAVFVAAEFSLTALERSTVESNARSGNRRDQLVQRAHRTLSTQLSGAQVGISITTLATGFLAEPVLARLIKPGLAALSVPERVATGIALILAILIATSVSMVFGELVPKNLAVARPVPTARVVRRPAADVLVPVHAADPAHQRHRQLDPAPAGHRTGRGAALRALAAGAGVAGAHVGPAAARSTPSPPCWWTGRCSSATAPPRN